VKAKRPWGTILRRGAFNGRSKKPWGGGAKCRNPERAGSSKCRTGEGGYLKTLGLAGTGSWGPGSENLQAGTAVRYYACKFFKEATNANLAQNKNLRP